MNFFILIPLVILYISILGLLSYIGYRSTRKSSDYLLGGRNSHPFVMALSYGATFISTSAIVGFGGMAGQFGLSLLWLPFLNIFVGAFIAFIVFGKRTRTFGLYLDSHTFGEFLGARVSSKFVQIITGCVIFLFMPLYTAAVLMGASRILTGLTGSVISYEVSIAFFSIMVAIYVIMGGIKGIMYTDALQGSLMFVGMIILLIASYAKLGGVTAAHSGLLEIADQVPQGLQAIGHQGWTASPAANSPLWWMIYSSLVLGVGIGVLAQPQLCVRYMTVKSNKELNRAVFIGGLFLLVTVGTPLTVGALSNLYFFNESGQIAIAAAGSSDNIIPMYIANAMPKWFGYMFMLVMISAAMSTLSSQFHAIGTAVSRDIIEGLFGKKFRAKTMLISRFSVIFAILVTVVLSFTLGDAKGELGIIARATAIFFGIMASGFLFPYGASLFWKRLTRVGCIAGILSGLFVVILGYLLMHGPEAKIFGLAKLLCGRDSIFPTGSVLQYVNPLVYAFPISGISTVIFSLLTKVENPVVVEACFGLLDKREKCCKLKRLCSRFSKKSK
ncbi:MAG: sodium:solute symporter family protein [Spirochaetales bacterium]|nr:sodium:solute symporter family protein [Spirochaetales bacterium]